MTQLGHEIYHADLNNIGSFGLKADTDINVSKKQMVHCPIKRIQNPLGFAF